MNDLREKIAKAMCLAMDDHYSAGKAFWLYQADLLLALPEIAKGQLAIPALERLLEVAEFAYMGAANQPCEFAAARTILRMGEPTALAIEAGTGETVKQGSTAKPRKRGPSGNAQPQSGVNNDY